MFVFRLLTFTVTQNFCRDINSQTSLTETGIDVTTLLSEFRRTIQEQKARKCDCK